MNVRRKPSGAWEVRVYDPNSGKQSGRTFRTKAEALAWGHKQEVGIRQGTWVQPSLGKVTLSRWWAQYQEGPAWSKLRPSTQESHRSRMEKHVLPHLGKRSLSSLHRTDIDAWVTKLIQQGTSPATVRAAHRVLRRTLQVAVDTDVLARNPASGVETPKPPRDEMRFLSPQEVHAIVEATSERYQALLLVMAYGGLRVGEATALRLPNVDLLRGRVQIVEAYSEVAGKLILGETKTQGSRRAVVLPATVTEALRAHVEAFPPGPGGLVFTAPEGGPIRRTNLYHRVWTPAIKQAAIPAPLPRIHDLRHTAVAMAIAVGAHPKVIQSRAGHSSITVTMDRYGHLFPGQDEALAESLDRIAADGTRSVLGLDAPTNVVALGARNA